MSEAADDATRRAQWVREGLVLLGFLLLVAAAVVTVVIPELREAPEDVAGAGAPDAGVP